MITRNACANVRPVAQFYSSPALNQHSQSLNQNNLSLHSHSQSRPLIPSKDQDHQGPTVSQMQIRKQGIWLQNYFLIKQNTINPHSQVAYYYLRHAMKCATTTAANHGVCLPPSLVCKAHCKQYNHRQVCSDHFIACSTHSSRWCAGNLVCIDHHLVCYNHNFKSALLEM